MLCLSTVNNLSLLYHLFHAKPGNTVNEPILGCRGQTSYDHKNNNRTAVFLPIFLIFIHANSTSHFKHSGSVAPNHITTFISSTISTVDITKLYCVALTRNSGIFTLGSCSHHCGLSVYGSC